MFVNRSKLISAKVALVACVTAVMFLGGCAGSKYGKQTVKPNYYKGCYQPIAQLRSDEDAKAQNAAAGAVLGAIAGGIIGYQSKGATGAAVGAVAGAVVGGAASYLITDSIQKKNQSERFAAYSQALDYDIRGLQNAVAAAKLTSKCYENAYKDLEKAYKAKQISKEEMVSRLTEIRDGTNDANTILTNYSAAIAENQVVYRDIQRVESQKGSKSITGAQMKTINSKQQQLSKVNSETQKEIEALKQLNQRCSSQLNTITAQSDILLPGLARTEGLSICPSAGAE